MRTICSNNIADLYKQALSLVRSHGDMTKPRGFNCQEITPVTMTLQDPWNNILTNKTRQINKAFAAAELVWMMAGRSDVSFIEAFNSKIAYFSDDGMNFFGAYGPKIREQLPYVLEMLEQDPWTRQAVMTIWRESPGKTKDVPCTIMFHFMRRPLDVLNMTVYMRSNDIWLGLPYDIHNFTCIQMLVSSMLKLIPGEYTHIDGSLHAYEKDFAKIDECLDLIKPDEYEATPTCEIDNLGHLDQELTYLQSGIHMVREGLSRGTKHGMTDTMFISKLDVMQEFLRRKNESHNS